MAEYVADADECDQQPYGERDKATSPKVGEQILQSPTKDQPNWSCQGYKQDPWR